jgi:hypothetical protein
MTQVDVAGETLRLTFDRWDAEAYALFLKTKGLPEHALAYDEEGDRYTIETPARFAKLLGLEVAARRGAELPLASHLFDYQRFFVRLALRAKRYAAWWDTGLGKTHLITEWGRQVQHLTGGRVLTIMPLTLIEQYLGIVREFYGEELRYEVLGSRDELVRWCASGAGLAIVNPEKFIPRDGQEVIPEISYLAGIAMDESSLLKTGGGKIKWALIKSCRGVEYKLSCTATPAPNDPIEYASQASWLEKIRDEGEVIWTYFVRDSDGEWLIKPHALPAFYRFLSGWSCYLRNPARYGFRDNVRPLPDPVRILHRIAPTEAQLAETCRLPEASGQRRMFGATTAGVVDRLRNGQLASGFLYEDGGARRVPSLKPGHIADVVEAEAAAGLKVLVWTQFDETAEILRRFLDVPQQRIRVETLTGSVPVKDRAAMIDRFRTGPTQVLITRPKVLGFGTNLQACGSMVFADISDSYEQLYQAERRAYRYGQQRSVRIHVPIVPELQTDVWENLERKRALFERDVEVMERLYVDAMRDQLEGETA